jgi:opacity protein-like surface antigen
MRSLKTFALTAAAIAALAPQLTQAADLPPPILPPPPIEEYGGWYLRGDIGMTNQNVSKLDNLLFATTANLVIHDKNFESGMLFGIGLGYEYNNWLRFDGTIEYRGETGFHGFDTWTSGVADPRFNNYTAKKSEWLFLLNGYLDLGTWRAVTPFIGAGIGASRVTIHSFRDAGINYTTPGDLTTAVPTMAFANAASKWNFAWALYAGLAYDVTPNFTVELAYRYVDLGDGQSGDIVSFDGSNPNNNPMHFKGLTSHDLKLGVRWLLADLGVTHWQPPLVRKY